DGDECHAPSIAQGSTPPLAFAHHPRRLATQISAEPEGRRCRLAGESPIVPAMPLALGLVLSLIALVVAVIALLGRSRRGEDPDFRIAALEAQVRALVARVQILEVAAGRSPAPAAAPPPEIETETVPVAPAVTPATGTGPAVMSPAAAAGEAPTPVPPAARMPLLDLEQ